MGVTLLALGAAVFGALVSIVSKMALRNIDSVTLTMLRSFIMSLFLLLVAVEKGVDYKTIHRISAKELGLIALSGLLGAISWLLYFAALRSSKSTLWVYVLDKSSVLWVLVFSSMLLGEGFTAKRLVGAILIILGMILIV